ncbi:hypothetical protein GJ496_008468 [Pomphorhynchus laevis]|nr:hypothetical protein GJ496_008468 [Pomphorhynchus laevis]
MFHCFTKSFFQNHHLIITAQFKHGHSNPQKHSDRLNIIPKAASSQHQREHVPSKQTSRFQKFIKVMFISFLIIGAILGVVWLFGFYYQEQQRRNKRFY